MKPEPLEMKAINRGLSESSRSLVRIRLLSFCLLAALGSRWSIAFGQQPASASAPLFNANAKYVQGVGPGYWPTPGSGLTLNLAAGTAFCNASLVTYAGGTLTLVPNATNYVYLDPAAGCAPASNTTGFSPGHIPLAKIVTGASSITTVTDVRGWFVPQPVVTDSSGGAIASLKKLNGVRFADQFALVAGSSSCGIAEAYADLPATGGTVVLGADCTITSAQTISMAEHKGFTLEGAGRTLSFSHATGMGLTVQTGVGYSAFTLRNLTFKYTGAGTAPSGLELHQVVNGLVSNVRFSGWPTTGGIELTLDSIYDYGFDKLHFDQDQGYTALKIQDQSNQLRFQNIAIQGATNAAIIITGGSNRITFDDYLVQSNPALKLVQIISATGDAANESWLAFRGGWWENNGDNTSNTHLFDIHADSGKAVIGLTFEDNGFWGQAAAPPQNWAYFVSGPGSVNSLLMKNNYYNSSSVNGITGMSAGAVVTELNDYGIINSTLAIGSRTISGSGVPGIALGSSGAAKQYHIFAGYPGVYDGYLEFWDLTAAASILSYHSNWWDTNGNSLTAGAGTLQAAAIQSNTANPATAGQFRLASGDALNFRNAANSGNVNGLSKDASNVVQVGGTAGAKTTGPLTVTTTSGAPLTVTGGDEGDGYSTSMLSAQGTGILPVLIFTNTTDSVLFADMYGLSPTGGFELDASGGDLNLGTDTGNVVLTPGTTGMVTARNFSTSVNAVTFSATPTFDASLGNTQQITLTGNVTSSTLSNTKAGQALSFIICQDGSGNHTLVWPTTVKGGMTISSTASKCSAQSFIVNSAGTTAYATSPGVTNM